MPYNFAADSFQTKKLCSNIEYRIKWAISLQREPVDPTFHVERVAPTNHSSSQKTRLNDLSYDIKNLDRSSFHFVRDNACDRRTDRILIARPRLHFMQRGKN